MLVLSEVNSHVENGRVRSSSKVDVLVIDCVIIGANNNAMHRIVAAVHQQVLESLTRRR